jgi:uncharacterized membrane protein YgcG
MFFLSGRDSALKLQHCALVVNMCVPMVTFLDASSSNNGSGSASSSGGGGSRQSGGGASRSSGGGKQSELSPAAPASRRYLCTSLIMDCLRRDQLPGKEMFIDLCYAFGTVLGLSMAAAVDLLADASEPITRMKAPAANALLHRSASDAPDGKRKVEDWVPSDPFLAPLYHNECCSTCGLIPGDYSQQFQICSLCKDPAAGQFCCKEPCFAAFWRAGHKNTCAGRDKVKKRGEGGGAGGGGGAAAGSSGATGC